MATVRMWFPSPTIAGAQETRFVPGWYEPNKQLIAVPTEFPDLLLRAGTVDDDTVIYDEKDLYDPAP